MSAYVDHKLKLTYEDLKQIPQDDPYRHGILDGMYVASPSPSCRHWIIDPDGESVLVLKLDASHTVPRYREIGRTVVPAGSSGASRGATRREARVRPAE